MASHQHVGNVLSLCRRGASWRSSTSTDGHSEVLYNQVKFELQGHRVELTHLLLCGLLLVNWLLLVKALV